MKPSQKQWPVLKHYEDRFTEIIAMPVGGIGTGNISIGGNGQWKDVEIMNKPGKRFNGAVWANQAPCFMVFTETKAGEKRTKALIGRIPPREYAGEQGSLAGNAGLPRFQHSSFDAAYPFAVVNLEDDQMPVSAKVRTFNPFIPGDEINSGIPIAVIRYEIKNKTSQPLTVAVAGSLNNFIGMDGSKTEFSPFDRSLLPVGAKNNRNTFKQTNTLAGIYMTSDGVDHDSSAWGSIALTTPKVSNDQKITYRTEFNPKGSGLVFINWGASIIDMWDDFSDDGMFKDISFDEKVNDPRAALSVRFELGPNETKEVEFLLTWHFPNRKSWDDKVTVGNYYSTSYTDAWDVAEKTLPQLASLEDKTIDFVNLIVNSNYPPVVKEAALFNTPALRSQLAFRDKQGYLFGWEGVFASIGSCKGSCSHVWNYEYATPFLFGDLAMKMREVDYKHNLDESTGRIGFRVELPLDGNEKFKYAAADGQMGTIMKAYREWQLSGDDSFLKEIYPLVKKALSFAWIPKGWDANKDGVMEGCQHNTMDIEYYGPNPEIGFWYLGALKAAAAMAHYLNDKDFENTCTALFNKGSKWIDENLFNGEYYIHKVQPVKTKDDIADGLSRGFAGKDVSNPDFQIGEGCLTDQLVGQNMALICGLGYLAKPDNIRKTLQSILKYNHVKAFGDFFNNMRSFALGDDAGLVTLTYPDPSKRPKTPLTYGSETWTGLEYTAATGMIYAGLNKEALDVITDIRNRHDGYKRNPFSEDEAGYHYARSMASWSAILAISGFHYSGVTHEFKITSTPGNYFWSNGHSWGNVEVSGSKVIIAVHHGKLEVQAIKLDNGKELKSKKIMTTITENNSSEFVIEEEIVEHH